MTLPRYIAVEGPIGVGKTSLTRRLAASLGATALYEGADENPFLPQYYADPARYALATQLHFLCQRTRQLQPHAQGDFFQPLLVADFMFDKDRLFARIALDEDEYALYDEIFRRFAPQVPTPELVIYLAAPLPALRARIARRARPYEQAIADAYLERLCVEYDTFFHAYRAAPVLLVDTTRVNFVDDDTQYARLVEALRVRFEGMRAFPADPERRAPPLDATAGAA
ncbi:MAG: deoxynucleoside kinase [Gammaproteobacteria bacterium]